MTSTSLVGYFALFAATAFCLVLVALMIGWFLRPKKPSKEKLAIYECGEEPIGSSKPQFDLRFYVVALVFLIFDVELAFFFPWSLVFGRAAQLASSPAIMATVNTNDADADAGMTVCADADGKMCDSAKISTVRTASLVRDSAAAGNDKVTIERGQLVLQPKTRAAFAELGVREPTLPVVTDSTVLLQAAADQNAVAISEYGKKMMRIAMADMAVFFLVLMVGFAYVWRRGDLDWIRTWKNRGDARLTLPED
ncbi:MAG: NADH-quinone oxidoreductase subunit A [Thermoguttaceae bacterium]|nr:NADH-quinone oxidoreductase subunit A [Thermoguttaceae bacterium]